MKEIQMKHIVTAVLVITGIPSLAAAQSTVQEGRYHVRTDGGQGTLTVANGHVGLSVAGATPGVCAGGIEGKLSSVEDGLARFSETQGDLSCTVTMNVGPDGRPVSLVSGTGCTSFHGFSCSFSGEIVGPDIAVSIEAIDAAFNARSAAERRAVQQILLDRGHYSGSIDGVTGIGTRGALIAAAREDITLDQNVSLETTASATRYLLFLLDVQPESPTSGSQAPDVQTGQVVSAETIIGTWTCNTPGSDHADVFEITDRQVTIRMFEMTVSYETAVPIGDRSNAFTLELSDGGLLGLFDIEHTTMIMMGASMVFDCDRTG